MRKSNRSSLSRTAIVVRYGADVKERSELLERGIAVHRVGDVYGKDRHGIPLSATEKDKWFVSALADSPLASTVQNIPQADTEHQAWELAAQHVSAALHKITT